jgi:hypothetical protein
MLTEMSLTRRGNTQKEHQTTDMPGNFQFQIFLSVIFRIFRSSSAKENTDYCIRTSVNETLCCTFGCVSLGAKRMIEIGVNRSYIVIEINTGKHSLRRKRGRNSSQETVILLRSKGTSKAL